MLLVVLLPWEREAPPDRITECPTGLELGGLEILISGGLLGKPRVTLLVIGDGPGLIARGRGVHSKFQVVDLALDPPAPSYGSGRDTGRVVRASLAGFNGRVDVCNLQLESQFPCRFLQDALGVTSFLRWNFGFDEFG